MPLLVFSLLILVGLWIYRDFTRQRERRDSIIVVPAPNRPRPPRHQRVTDAELRERAQTLRSAIAAKAVTLDDAVESLSRTCGISEDEARSQLRG